MKINRGREPGTGSKQRNETFVGEVWGDPVLAGVDDVTINNVFFASGGRTNWHSHNGPQVLLVLSGSGFAFTRSGEGGEIRSGDVVYIPADEEHWHGADADSFLLHTAITFGKHNWLGPVTEEEYGAVTGRVAAAK